MVVARSAAEIPVVVPRRASTVTVNAVPCASAPCATIGGRCSASQRSPGRATQSDAARVAEDEGDRLGGGLLGGEDQVALVLAVGVVHDDDRLPARDPRNPSSTPASVMVGLLTSTKTGSARRR